MAEELFKQNNNTPKAAAKSEPSGSPAVPGQQPNQPASEPDANQTGSGPSNVTPPAKKEEGKGDPAQTTQIPDPLLQQPSANADQQPAQKADAQLSDEDVEEVKPDELFMLKRRADLMNIPYSNNIGLDALRKKVNDAAEGKKEEAKEVAPIPSGSEDTPVRAAPKSKTPTLRAHLIKEKMKLIRCRITNLDPKKKDLPGEIITVANGHLGTIRKFVPYGEVTDNGYHLPQILYDFLKERTFVNIKVRKDSNGRENIEPTNAREFSLEVLPQLTAAELAQLSVAQMAKGGLSD